MPLYDYQCPECGQVMERKHAPGATGMTHWCDTVGQEVTLDRLLSMPAVHLKGYGFYATDNRHTDEKYSFDHFDGSGTNPEMKARERRIHHPDSTVTAYRKD